MRLLAIVDLTESIFGDWRYSPHCARSVSVFHTTLIFATCGNQECISQTLALFRGDGCQTCAPQVDPFDPPTTPPQRPERGGASPLLSPLNRERTLGVSRSVKKGSYFLNCATLVPNYPVVRIFMVSAMSAFWGFCFIILSDTL